MPNSPIDPRAEAMRLLCDGFTPGQVAKLLGLQRATVKTWKSSPEGVEALRKARLVYALILAGGNEQAKRELRKRTQEAARRLLEAG